MGHEDSAICELVVKKIVKTWKLHKKFFVQEENSHTEKKKYLKGKKFIFELKNNN